MPTQQHSSPSNLSCTYVEPTLHIKHSPARARSRGLKFAEQLHVVHIILCSRPRTPIDRRPALELSPQCINLASDIRLWRIPHGSMCHHRHRCLRRLNRTLCPYRPLLQGQSVTNTRASSYRLLQALPPVGYNRAGRIGAVHTTQGGSLFHHRIRLPTHHTSRTTQARFLVANSRLRYQSRLRLQASI